MVSKLSLWNHILNRHIEFLLFVYMFVLYLFRFLFVYSSACLSQTLTTVTVLRLLTFQNNERQSVFDLKRRYEFWFSRNINVDVLWPTPYGIGSLYVVKRGKTLLVMKSDQALSCSNHRDEVNMPTNVCMPFFYIET